LNFVQLSEDGDMYTMTNERGTTEINVQFPTGFRVIGHTVLDQSVFVALANPSGSSQIGEVRYDGTYQRLVPAPGEDEGQANNNSELLLSIDRPVDMVARQRLGEFRFIYFCDGPQGRPMGFINVDNPPAIGEITDNTRVIPNRTLTQIDLDSIDETAGSLQLGTYRFVTRYYTQDLTPTGYGLVSGGVPIVENTFEEGRDQYDGEFPDFGPVNKTINLTLSNVDTSFPFIELVAVYYAGVTQEFRAEALPLINITGETMNVSYSGNETGVTNVTQEALNFAPISYSGAKAVVQKDNRLFWSNLSDNSAASDSELQRFFNDSTVEYVVEEIEYRPSSRETNIKTSDLELESLPYTSIDDNNVRKFINLNFNQSVEAGEVSDYTYTVGATPGQVQGSVLTNMEAGDTVELVAGATTHTFTAVSSFPVTGATVFQFVVGTNEDDTALNLVNAINAAQTDFVAAIAGSGSEVFTIESTTTGTTANSYTATYSPNTVSATHLQFLDTTTGDVDLSTTNFVNGQDATDYTPIAVNTLSGNDSVVVLTFDNTLFFAETVPSGGTLTFITSAFNGLILSTSETVASSPTEPAEFLDQGEFTDYKNPTLTFRQIGYRRGEVYSLGGVVTYLDGSQSFNYHIPGNDKETLVTTEAIPANSTPVGDTSGLMGTYVSEIDYPTNQNYPGPDEGDDNSTYSTSTNGPVTASNRLVRHHKMPHLNAEPHVRVSNDLTKTYIRVLGIRITFNSALTETTRDQIQAISITRQLRDTTENKSVFAQGLTTRHFNTFNDYPFGWRIGNQGNAQRGPSDPVVRRLPFFDNLEIENLKTDPFDRVDAVSTGADRESVAFEVSNVNWGNDTSWDPEVMQASDHRVAFFGPDVALIDENPNNIQGAFMRRVGTMLGTWNQREFNPSRAQQEFFGTAGVGYVQTTPIQFPRLWVYGDYIVFQSEGFQENPSVDTDPIIDQAQYIPQGTRVNIPELDDPIDNTHGGRYFYLRTNRPLSRRYNKAKLVLELDGEYNGNVVGYGQLNVNNEDRVERPDSNSLMNYLYNIETANNRQYGSPSGAQYVLCATITEVPSTPGFVIDRIYGGDTFIGKYSYRNNDFVKMKGFQDGGATTIGVGVPFERGYTLTNMEQADNSVGEGMNFKSIGYFFAESIANSEYRHQFINRADPNNPQPGADYYPNVDIDNALATTHESGDSNTYNPQYSQQNTVRFFNNKLAASITVGGYPNRTIYSERSLEDDLSDSYRLYSQNSFYDMPQHTGPIWDNFVYNNTLYLHTPKSLWRAYVNDVTNTATSVGDVVLGTGGLFSIPAKEVIVSTGGYAGTISQWGGVITPYGYYFPDVLQGKMFMLQGDQLREISQKGLQMHFTRTMEQGIINADGSYNDNPFTGAGYMGGYDFELKRYINIKTGTDFDETWSFSSLSEAWLSRHSYNPNLLYSINNRIFAVVNGTSARLYEHNLGPYGNFYGTEYDSSLQMVFNEGAALEKVWDNLKIKSKVYNRDGVLQLDTFDTIQVKTDTRNTGAYTIVASNQFGRRAVIDNVTEVLARRVNSSYNLTIPRDAVVDSSLDITLPGNLDQARPHKPRIKGDHMVLDLTFNNEEDRKLVLNFIQATFRVNPS
jgi:hypothetical protein